MVEAVNGNIKALLRRGRGYRNLHYLLLKAQRMAVQKTEFVVFERPHKMATLSDSCAEPYFGRSLTKSNVSVTASDTRMPV